jgi:hypothetical protein
MSGATVNDPVFGELRWHEWGFFLGKVSLTPKHRVTISVLADPGDDPAEGIAFVVYRDTFNRIRRNEYGCRCATAAFCVKDFNSTWRDQGDQEESIDSFARKLQLHLVEVFASGEATLYYVTHERIVGSGLLMSYLNEAGAVIASKIYLPNDESDPYAA